MQHEHDIGTATTEAAATCPASQPSGPAASIGAVPDRSRDLLQMEAVASRLGCTTEHVRHLLSLPATSPDHLACIRWSKRVVRVDPRDLDRWIARHRDGRVS